MSYLFTQELAQARIEERLREAAARRRFAVPKQRRPRAASVRRLPSWSVLARRRVVGCVTCPG